jgi:hypothetical protein
VGIKGRNGGVREDDGPRPPVFRVFEREAGSRLREGSPRSALPRPEYLTNGGPGVRRDGRQWRLRVPERPGGTSNPSPLRSVVFVEAA